MPHFISFSLLSANVFMDSSPFAVDFPFSNHPLRFFILSNQEENIKNKLFFAVFCGIFLTFKRLQSSFWMKINFLLCLFFSYFFPRDPNLVTISVDPCIFIYLTMCGIFFRELWTRFQVNVEIIKKIWDFWGNCRLLSDDGLSQIKMLSETEDEKWWKFY